MRKDLENAYMEIIPVAGIEKKLGVLQENMHMAVTCSPTRGVDATLELTEKLIAQGFQVTPHISAKSVRGERHLETIITRLEAMSIQSIFVPGGDAPEPIGNFNNAYDLLKALQKCGHNIKKIGIAAHPEGHPDINEKILMESLEKKKDLADFIVTQMCFDATALGDWLLRINKLPGAIERGRLLKTSLRIGVGDSLRFLRKKSRVAAELMKSSVYNPKKLVTDISEYKDISDTNLIGYHIFSFNQIEKTEKWRKETISSLT